MEIRDIPSAGRLTPVRTRLARLPAPLVELTAGRITLIYLGIGLAALVLSDYLIVGPLSDPVLAQVQAIKGLTEILLTGGLIFGLTRTHQAQLTRATATMERQRDELHLLHRVERHNLRNDLNVLYGMVDLDADGDAPTDSPDREAVIRDKLDAMLSNIEHLRRIREVTNGDPATVTVSLADAIDSVLETHPDVTDDVAVTVSVPGDTVVECNHMLHEAVQELLTNAIKHNTAPEPEIHIRVEPDEGPPGMVPIHVTDNGPGLPSMEVEAIRARKGEELSQVLHSNGLGLWFVDWMITNSGGDLQVDTDDPEGTRITLCVPEAGSRYTERPVM